MNTDKIRTDRITRFHENNEGRAKVWDLNAVPSIVTQSLLFGNDEKPMTDEQVTGYLSNLDEFIASSATASEELYWETSKMFAQKMLAL